MRRKVKKIGSFVGLTSFLLSGSIFFNDEKVLADTTSDNTNVSTSSNTSDNSNSTTSYSVYTTYKDISTLDEVKKNLACQEMLAGITIGLG